MKLLLIMLLSAFCLGDVSYTEIHGSDLIEKRSEEKAEKLINESEKIFNSFYSIAVHSNLAIRNIIKIAAKNMRRKGFKKEADFIENNWEKYDGQLIDISISRRDIGDFEPISEYLAIAYELMEASLGLDVCHILRFTDIKTINHGLRVCFRPCFYGYDNFYEHFVHDEKYRGLGPVLSYWSVVIGCSVGTYGIGYFFVCSPIGILVEAGVNKYVAPKAAPKLYNMACSL